MFSYTKPFTVPEQFKTAIPDQMQHQFQQQFALLQSLTGKAIEGAEKLLELNLHLGHDSIEHSRAVAQKLFAAKSAQEFFSHSSDLFKPNFEQLLNYGRKLIHIATESQAQVLQAAVQKAEKSEKEFVKLVVEAEKKAEHLIDESHHNARTAIKKVSAAIEAANGNKKVADKPVAGKKDSQSAPAAKKVQPKAEQNKPAKATTKSAASKNSNFPPQLPVAPLVKPAKPVAKAKSAATPARPASSKAATPAESKPAATVAAAIEPITSAVATNTEKTAAAADAASNVIATEINTIE